MRDMTLQKSSVIEPKGRRFVEMVFSDQTDLDDKEQHLILRIEIDAAGYPRLPAAQLEALQHVRNTITNEIQRLEQIRGQAHPNEDWRK